MNDFIYLNDKLFQYINRQYTEQQIGGKLERTLSGSGSRDIVCTKKKWAFSFEVDDRNYLRIKSIFDLKSSFILIDWDDESYSVIITNDFNPQSIDINNFSIVIEMEEK